MPIFDLKELLNDPEHNPQPNPQSNPQHRLEAATALVADDMVKVNQVITDNLKSDIALINTLGSHIVSSGGKRLRPVILLLSAKVCDYQGSDHTLLAAVIEFIHTATLLHDDVVDSSATRRGKPTASEVWGNPAAVLVGDFLYSRSFEMMVKTSNMKVMDIISATTNSIAEGEVLQLLNAHSADTSEKQYFDTIMRKTAKLFEAAAQLGGVIADANPATAHALAQYGLHIGSAFQLVDDMLDYAGEATDIGKDLGDDLAEGKPTLPLIYALQHGTTSQQALIRDAIKFGRRDKIGEVLEIISDTNAITYTLRRAQTFAAKAIDAITTLPQSVYRNALISLAEFSVIRRH